ncbi:glycosyltransferase [Synechococcus sp. UW179A]|uniref:glycosyltransferase n=1 Tax=Synechococcus sp. UW179A TaxID=2575510 RepID=UPI000E0F6104|nr:glycosyltransferase [Synechococcus sp. UW179A]
MTVASQRRELERERVLVLAPTARAASETFVRANLQGLPFAVTAYFGDERPLHAPWRLTYGTAIWLSKLFTRLSWLRLAGWPAAVVVRALIRRHQPDVVMVEFGFEAVRVMEACAWSGVPLVVHFRGSDASAQGRLGLLRERYRRLLDIAAGVIVKSRPMADTLLTLGARSDRLLISPSGANSDLFHGSEPAQTPPRLLAVGRFVAKKGPLQTIRSFAQMCQSLGPVTPQPALWMVGDGPLLKQARILVRDLELQEHVRLLGECPQAQVADLMRQVRGFVQHSMVAPDGDSEGNPVAVMEAQLSGLPVVATRHAGIPEVVMDGQSGLLVEEGDETAMAQAMARLVQDPALAARLGDCGRQRVQERFTIEHHLQQVSQLLHQVMQDRSESL